MKFNFDDYKGKYVMHCKTEEEADNFCLVMHEDGRMWTTGESYLDETGWRMYKEESCYNFNFGMRSDRGYCEERNYTILEWSDFMKKEFTKADLKDGMVLIDEEEDMYVLLNGKLMRSNGNAGIALSSYSNDLKWIGDFLCFGIIEVCESGATVLSDYFKRDYLKTIWKRNDVIDIDVEEIKKKFGVDVDGKIRINGVVL